MGERRGSIPFCVDNCLLKHVVIEHVAFFRVMERLLLYESKICFLRVPVPCWMEAGG